MCSTSRSSTCSIPLREVSAPAFRLPARMNVRSRFVVESSVAATQPLIMSMNVSEIQKFKRGFLRKLRPDLHGRRRDWERFVAIRAHADAMSMHPRLMPGAVVLIDRHYNSLQPYRHGELNISAVQVKDVCKIRYLELAGDNLVLRPHNQSYGVEIVPLEKGRPQPTTLLAVSLIRNGNVTCRALNGCTDSSFICVAFEPNLMSRSINSG